MNHVYVKLVDGFIHAKKFYIIAERIYAALEIPILLLHCNNLCKDENIQQRIIAAIFLS